MILNDIISEPRTGCVGEFATFGFLTFLISLLNTLLNLGKLAAISKQIMYTSHLILCLLYGPKLHKYGFAYNRY